METRIASFFGQRLVRAPQRVASSAGAGYAGITDNKELVEASS